ncbi:MAG: GNAT family N-acetyltransferase [Aggregatilineales bacterium]
MAALSLREQRARLSGLLDVTSPVDAPTAYYALDHDPKRSTLALRIDADGSPIGFVGRFQTGIDLFRPLVVMQCRHLEIAADLLAEVLTSGRQYLFFSNLNQLALVGGSMQLSHERILSIYALDLTRFKPEINVLVRLKTAPNGTPIAEISSGGYRAVAGVNWQSSGFAEIYVHVDPEVRGRGWGRSVVMACTERVRASGRIPLYLVEPSNAESVKLAESIGYRDTGARQIFAEALYLGHPGRKAAQL